MQSPWRTGQHCKPQSGDPGRPRPRCHRPNRRRPSRPGSDGSARSTSAPGRTIRVAMPSAAASRSTSSSWRDLPHVYAPSGRGFRGRGVPSSWTSHGVRGGRSVDRLLTRTRRVTLPPAWRAAGSGSRRSSFDGARRSRQTFQPRHARRHRRRRGRRGQANAQIGGYPLGCVPIVGRPRTAADTAHVCQRRRSPTRGSRERRSQPRGGGGRRRGRSA